MAFLMLHLLLLLAFAAEASKSPPNIIFILADDLAWNAGGFGGYNNSDLDMVTPYLNSYSSKGIKLSNYYAQESCTPSRSSLMTGRYPLSVGMQYGGVETDLPFSLGFDETLFPQALKGSGDHYTTYMLGKWNLGHFSGKALPSSRGFDYFLAYQSSATLYWSKFHPEGMIFGNGSNEEMHFTDFLYGDNTCYSGYDGDDKHDYSTWLYSDKAVNIIKHHDYDKKGLFLYVAFQAVHDPYIDLDFPEGMPRKYISTSMYKKIKKSVVGRKRRQLAMALSVLDSSVKSIVDAVDDAGQLDNTYIIFTSDNGGCYKSGGRNGPLRGNKGTLFEGGTKVNAFIYTTKLKARGATYGGLFHVSDWFPTLLDAAGVGYTPASGYELDGVSHWNHLKKLSSKSVSDVADGPREHMLYNYYINVSVKSWDSGTVRAVRNKQFKLLETYTDNGYSDWNSADELEEDDDSLSSLETCTQGGATGSGTYTSFLFDLTNDPYETTNLYDEGAYADVIEELEGKLAEYAANAKEDEEDTKSTKACYPVWKEAGNVIVPWVKEENAGEGYPVLNTKGCDFSLLSPLYRDNDDDGGAEGDDDDFKYVDDDDLEDTAPTLQPTHKPTS